MSVTNLNDYEPSAKEWALLEALTNPEYRHYNITKICKVAEISRKSYYDMLAKPEFGSYLKRLRGEMIKDHVHKILAATIEFAVSNPKNHQDRRMLLEMAGEYKETQRREIAGELGHNVKMDLSKLNDEELSVLERLLTKSADAE